MIFLLLWGGPRGSRRLFRQAEDAAEEPINSVGRSATPAGEWSPLAEALKGTSGRDVDVVLGETSTFRGVVLRISVVG